MSNQAKPHDITTTNSTLLAEIDNRAKMVVAKRRGELEEKYNNRSIKKTLWQLHDAMEPEVLENWARNNIGELLSMLVRMETKDGKSDNATQISGGVQILNQFFAANGQGRPDGGNGGVGEEGPILSAEICDGEEGR